MTKKMRRLVDSYLAAQKKIAKFKKVHATLFEKFSEVEDEARQFEGQIKDLARREAKAGESIKVVEEDEISIEVVGPQSAQQYEPASVKRFWGLEVYRKVSYTAIDPAEVKALLEDGTLSETQIAKAALPRETLTPRVNIKLNLGERP